MGLLLFILPVAGFPWKVEILVNETETEILSQQIMVCSHGILVILTLNFAKLIPFLLVLGRRALQY